MVGPWARNKLDTRGKDEHGDNVPTWELVNRVRELHKATLRPRWRAPGV